MTVRPGAAPLPVADLTSLTTPLLLPKGYGLRRLTLPELRERATLFDCLLVWELPRSRGPRRYVIGVDVADGIGKDRSVIDVQRLGTIDEPAEQVAQYVSDQVSPVALAYIVQTIGQWYQDEDHIEALVAIENNNHGLSTQDTLQLHLGYQHFYRWEYYDAADPASRFSTKIGWSTTPRTRPILLDKFHTALTTLDPITHLPDLLTHSPILHEELKDFQTEGALWEAEAARGAHDDCVMASAITYYVGWRLAAGEHEPLEDRRRRRSEQQALLLKSSTSATLTRDFRNTPATADDQSSALGKPVDSADADDDEELLYDPRTHDDSLGADDWGWDN